MGYFLILAWEIPLYRNSGGTLLPLKKKKSKACQLCLLDRDEFDLSLLGE